ncbi:MAG: hypothetical protein JWL90_1749 [Chthoniobacteraceae bacterium]|nr:hypothetical protein [Chthoniobacteraceae bacterium]MDB6175599.1 hypothetical protein [Chthoniobacteraceae bacterium]
MKQLNDLDSPLRNGNHSMVSAWNGTGHLNHFLKLAKTAPILVVLAVSGCGQRFTNSNIDVVNKQFELAEKQSRGGVTPKEVEAILGQPLRAETKTIPLETQKKEVEVVRYYYEQDGRIVEMHFMDNKLIARVPHLEASKPAPAKPHSK